MPSVPRMLFRRTIRATIPAAVALLFVQIVQADSAPPTQPGPAERPATCPDDALRREVQGHGWIVYGALADRGDWDLFLIRPDGSRRTNITHSPGVQELGACFSPDGKKLLYRRLQTGRFAGHDKWGSQGELIIADADGRNSQSLGKPGELPWASWAPDGQSVFCLVGQEVQQISLADKQVLKRWPAKGYYQQLCVSPDGKACVGTSSLAGEWTIARMELATGRANVAAKFRCCTPDWCPDSRRVVYSSRPAGQAGYGWTQVWSAGADGAEAGLIVGQEGQHLYGAAVSPDGKYVLFTAAAGEGGGYGQGGGRMGLVRLADAPVVLGPSPAMRKLYPQARDGPTVIVTEKGWEPCWTLAEINLPE